MSKKVTRLGCFDSQKVVEKKASSNFPSFCGKLLSENKARK